MKLFNAPTEYNPHPRGVQRVYHFQNGFGASLIPSGRYWELAVLDGALNWGITYDTAITEDVIPGLTDDEAEEYLIRISGLLREIEGPAAVERPEPMTGKALMSALLAFHAERTEYRATSAADILIHAYSVVYGVEEDEATEFVADELADRRAARA